MKFGITMFPTEYTIAPAALGKAVEERGFDSLFLPEHTHIPTSRRTPWPGGSELPREYSHIIDPFVALATVAASTERLLIGTGVCLVPQHDPIITAKQVASLDLLSAGRLIFGVGAGWNREETESHGTDPPVRFAVMRERILAMKEIWTKEEAEFHGKYVDLGPLWSWPKPVQKPHPPVYVGGDGPHTLERVAEYGDAWMPIPARSRVPLQERMAQLREMAQAAGRGPIPVTVYGTLPQPEVINHYAEIGVERGLFWMPASAEGEALGHLDRFAKVMEEFARAGA